MTWQIRLLVLNQSLGFHRFSFQNLDDLAGKNKRLCESVIKLQERDFCSSSTSPEPYWRLLALPHPNFTNNTIRLKHNPLLLYNRFIEVVVEKTRSKRLAQLQFQRDSFMNSQSELLISPKVPESPHIHEHSWKEGRAWLEQIVNKH